MNCDHLAQFSRDLYSQLVRYPQEVIPTFDLATNELFSKLYPDTTLREGIQVCVCVSVCVCEREREETSTLTDIAVKNACIKVHNIIDQDCMCVKWYTLVF